MKRTMSSEARANQRTARRLSAERAALTGSVVGAAEKLCDAVERGVDAGRLQQALTDLRVSVERLRVARRIVP